MNTSPNLDHSGVHLSTPTNIRSNDMLDNDALEECIKNLTEASALLHDIGKASVNFQNKLRCHEIMGENVRHEWLSMRLAELLLRKMPNECPDEDEKWAWNWWAQAWNDLTDQWTNKKDQSTSNTFLSAFHSFKSLESPCSCHGPSHRECKTNGCLDITPTSLKGALYIAIATHHKLFGGSITDLEAKCHTNRKFHKDIKETPFIDYGYFSMSQRWTDDDQTKMSDVLCRFYKVWEKLLDWEAKHCSHVNTNEFWQGVLYISRSALIVSDQYISSQSSSTDPQKTFFEYDGKKELKQRKKLKKDGVWANTTRGVVEKNDAGIFAPNQTLPEHLKRVADYAVALVQHFFAKDVLPIDQKIWDKLRSTIEIPSAFEWQKHCTEKLINEKGKWKDELFDMPFLVLNSASTGAGKTQMNARVLAALNTSEKFRFSAVFNLKTLTLQTRDAFVEQLQIPQNDVACIIGDRIALTLHNNPLLMDDLDETDLKSDSKTSKMGSYKEFCGDIVEYTVVSDRNEENKKNSKSIENFVKEMGFVQGNLDGLVFKPILVSTIDYLIKAGEPNKQIAHGLALLRVANSDLILDEIDSYDPIAIAAVLRVVKMAAYFGRNVVVSSATLPESIATSLWKAFNSGIRWRGQFSAFHTAVLDNRTNKDECCEIETTSELENFESFYDNFIDKKMKELNGGAVLRRAQIVDVVETINDDSVVHKKYVEQLTKSIPELHKNNCFKLKKGEKVKNVSFGLVRVANVIPCVELSKLLIKENVDGHSLHICPYHAVDLVLRRKMKEEMLDKVLKRKDSEEIWQADLIKLLPPNIFDQEEENIVFLVVATPVEEVGRDHDFDWAIIEPSSIASIVQTAGRVNRHRKRSLQENEINVHIFNRNIKNMLGASPVFSHPGNEKKHGGIFKEHNMSDLLLTNQQQSKQNSLQAIVDARLVFDQGNDGQRGCLFAQYDERSINKILDQVQNCIVGKINVGKQNETISFSWLSQVFYEEYVLRERSSKIQFKFEKAGNIWNLCKGELTYEKEKEKVEFTWNNIRFDLFIPSEEERRHPKSNNTIPEKGFWWLSEDISKVLEEAEKLDKQYPLLNFKSEGLSFSLLRHQVPTDNGSLGFDYKIGGYKKHKK